MQHRLVEGKGREYLGEPEDIGGLNLVGTRGPCLERGRVCGAHPMAQGRTKRRGEAEGR